MSSCSHCLLDTNHPFKPSFVDGVCNSCIKRSASARSKIDLRNLLDSQNRSGKRYDCIVVLKGTPEDYFVIGVILELGFYPLCVFVNSYFSTDICWKNVHNLIHKFDLELRTFNPNLTHYRKMVKYSLRRFSDVLTPSKLLTFRYVMNLSESLNVNVIISGENQVAKNSGKFLQQKLPECTAWSVLEHDGHTTSHDFFGPSLDLPQIIKSQYNPLNLNNSLTKWVFLSDFLRWDQLQQDFDALADGAIGQLEETTFDLCHRAGSSVFYRFHDLLRYQKFRSIKATDQLSREIRMGRIKKTIAIQLNNRFISETLQAERVESVLEDVCCWLGLKTEAVKWIKHHKLPEPVESTGITKSECLEWYIRILGRERSEVEPRIFSPLAHFCRYYKGAEI